MITATTQGLEVFTSWPAVVALAIVLILGPGGVTAAVLKAMLDRKARADQQRMEASVDLHRDAFDGAVEELEARLRAHIGAMVRPIVDRQEKSARQQEELLRDVARVEHKLDTNAQRHDLLEKDTYAAISRAERVIAKHHPEDAA